MHTPGQDRGANRKRRRESTLEIPSQYTHRDRASFLDGLEWEHGWYGHRRDMQRETLCREALANWEEDFLVIQKSDAPLAKLHNIVSTSHLGGEPSPINLQLLSTSLPCSSFNKHKFAAITIRVQEPKFTALLFTSGKLVVTGVKSFYQCILASLCMSRLINRALERTSFYISQCTIENIVGCVHPSRCLFRLPTMLLCLSLSQTTILLCRADM